VSRQRERRHRHIAPDGDARGPISPERGWIIATVMLGTVSTITAATITIAFAAATAAAWPIRRHRPDHD
jgi:hypothetical protein